MDDPKSIEVEVVQKDQETPVTSRTEALKKELEPEAEDNGKKNYRVEAKIKKNPKEYIGMFLELKFKEGEEGIWIKNDLTWTEARNHVEYIGEFPDAEDKEYSAVARTTLDVSMIREINNKSTTAL